MPDEKRTSIEYYTLMIDHLREGGCSPHMVQALEAQLKLYERSASLGEFQRKIEELNMAMEPPRAAKLDEYFSMERAARESGDGELAALYAGALESVRPLQNLNDLHTAEVRWAEKLRAFLAARDEVLYDLTGVMMGYADLKSLHGADRDRAGAIANLRALCGKIEAPGRSVEALLDHPWYRAHLPLTDAHCARAAREIRAMRSWADIDPEEIAAIRGKITESMRVIEGRAADLAALAADEDARARRREFLAVAPEDAPGPYTFEKIGESGA